MRRAGAVVGDRPRCDHADLLIMSGSGFTARAISSSRFGEILAAVMRRRHGPDGIHGPDGTEG